jgi:hypothetical protein
MSVDKQTFWETSIYQTDVLIANSIELNLVED